MEGVSAHSKGAWSIGGFVSWYEEKEEEESPMETRIYLHMLQRGWWIIVFAVVAAINISLVVSYTAVPQYRTSARFLVSPNQAQVGRDSVLDSLSVLDRPSIVSTYAEVLTSRHIYDDTAAALKLDPEPLRLLYTVSSAVVPGSNVVELTVQGPDPQLVVQLANGMGQHTIDYTNKLYRVYTIDVLDPAILPTAPYTPQPLRDAGIAALMGIVVGAVLAIVREQLHLTLDTLRQRSRLDGESQAYTRRFFQKQLGETLRNRAVQLSLAFIQLDGLAEMGGTLPRQIVQNALRRTSSILARELRGNDLVAHWSPTEFAVMLPSTPGPGAVRVLGRIQQALAQPVNLDGDTFMLGPRIGVATYQPGETMVSLVNRAQVALEQARQDPTRVASS